jgi:hypothetical protein
MEYVGIGVALFLLGVVVERTGPRLGTALALLPVVVWFVLLTQTALIGNINGPDGEALAVWLVTGLVAFLIGLSIARGFSSRRARLHRNG